MATGGFENITFVFIYINLVSLGEGQEQLGKLNRERKGPSNRREWIKGERNRRETIALMF